jgi:hypothetical protein
MEDKAISMSQFYVTLARIECLLEEIIFRQVLDSSGGDVDKANEVFKAALKNVSQSLKEHFESLPPVK